MERKMKIYQKYSAEQNINFDDREKNKIFGNDFSEEEVETLISLKMFQQREVVAAIMIQSSFRRWRVRTWYKLISALRNAAARKI
jgi:hypothetical protein